MQTLSRHRYELLAVCIALLFCGLHVWSDGQSAVGSEPRSVLLRGIQFLEGRITDLKFLARGPRSPHPDVVVVAIDERSAQQYGLWPWSRIRMAQAIERLKAYGVGSIGLDVTFTDETVDERARLYRELLEKQGELSAGAPTVESPRWEAWRAYLSESQTPSPDAALAQAFQGANQVVQGVMVYPASEQRLFSEDKRREQAELLGTHLIKHIPGAVPGSEVPVEVVPGWTQHSAQTPLPLLARTGTRMGHFNVVWDADGSVRRSPLFAKLEGAGGFLPSLALQAVASHWGAEPGVAYQMGMPLGARLKLPDGSHRLIRYSDDEPFVHLNYYGSAEQFPTVSIVDVIGGTLPPEAVRGKLALIGYTMAGSTRDQIVTPFASNEFGVYHHATLASNLLRDETLRRPSWMVFAECLAMLVVGLLLARVVVAIRSFTVKAVSLVATAIVWAVVAQVAFHHQLEISVAVPLGALTVNAFALIFLGYLSVDREKLKLRETFSRYLGADVMEEALQHPEKLTRGEKREMTVLFSDIRGFTTLAERMVPEKLSAFIKEYLSPMTQLVFDEKGTLDKYIGDAVMAFWNAPLDQADHALRACRAALRMQQKLAELKQKWRAESYPEFDIGIGISTGAMIVGNMGSEIRVDYTVMGDAVNLGSRLEGTNKEFGTRIIISELTWQAVKDQVICRRLGAVRVKGKRKPVHIFELRDWGTASGPEAEAISAFESAVDAYGDRRFEEAEPLFLKVLQLWPNDAPTRRYLGELAQFKIQPPGPGWDGVCGFSTS